MLITLNRFKGKIAVVTGASSGIGAATLKQLILESVNVVGLARRVHRIEQLAEELNKLQKGQVYAIKCDVTKENDVINAFEWIEKNLGPIHILVNNAGVLNSTSLIDGDYLKWKQTLDTNVLGLCMATRQTIKSMKKHNVAGHIININSLLGRPGCYIPKSVMYCASKFGVSAISEVLYRELLEINSKIKTTNFIPGYVHTEILSSPDEKKFRDFMETGPHLTGEEVAESIVYILSTPPHIQIKEFMIKPIGETL